ncbi:ABC transporter permease [Mycolicibacterium smegmatis]|uniref:Autoinducer 2 import system permease protein LsrC n=1 Tax=Mycolicibacterium smegmatis (strain MKD8) TaxID=1214915 RepID=A0A2U9PIF1_MYCSE|nr:ABC transporter permease [Mycolicibacterium smegmatis]AWT51458.1 ribose transport system permease protein RbsC [Mycolicibacterium smegmatis MKD8]
MSVIGLARGAVFADSKVRRFRVSGPLLPAGLLIALLAVIGINDPSFLSAESLRLIAAQSAPIVMFAVGLTPVILLGAIDLSIGALASFCSVLFVLTTPSLGVFGIAVVIGLAAILGALVGWTHAVAQVPSFVVTLGALGLYSGLALVISDARDQSLGAGASAFDSLTGFFATIPVTFVLAVSIAAVTAVVLHKTTLGRAVYAIGSGEAASIMSGLSPTRTRVLAFSFCSACAAGASAFLISGTGFSSPTLADGYLLYGIAAVLVGGTAISGGVGSVARSLLGGMVVAVVLAGLVIVGIDPKISDLVFGTVIIVVVSVTTNRRKLTAVK